VLLAAATSPEEAKLLKAGLLDVKPPNRAALGARNVITLGLYRRANRKALFKAARYDRVRLRTHWRFMRDAVIREAGAGREVDQTKLRALSQEAFRQVNALHKAELPGLEPPDRAALAARNIDVLRSYLRANQRSIVRSIKEGRAGEYERFLQDAVIREARAGSKVDQARLSALSADARGHVNAFESDEALKTYQAQRLAFEDKAASFIQLAAGNPSPEEMADRVMDLHESFDAMQRAKGLDWKNSGFDLFPRFEEAFARAASRSAPRRISPVALAALRTVHDAGGAIHDLRQSPLARTFDDFHLERFRAYGDGVRSTVAAIVAALAGAYGVPTTALTAVFKESEEDGGMASSGATGRKDPRASSEATRKSAMEALETRFRRQSRKKASPGEPELLQ
jgi:hypothetical protein